MEDIHAGDLNTLIEIHTKATTGTGGFKTTAYTKTFEAWAKVIFTQNMESSSETGTTVARTATLTVRHDTRINEKSRIVFGGDTYEIVTPVENLRMRGAWMVFKVRAVVSA